MKRSGHMIGLLCVSSAILGMVAMSPGALDEHDPIRKEDGARRASNLAPVIADILNGSTDPITPPDGGDDSGDFTPPPGTGYQLTLGEMTFDPLQLLPQVPPAWAQTAQDGPDLRLIQFDGPTEARWLREIESAGLEIVQYIHPYTYIVWGEPDALDLARAIPNARWAGEFIPAYRVLPQSRNLGSATVDVKVLMYRSANLDDVEIQFNDLGAVLMDWGPLDDRFDIVSYMLPGDAFADAASIPGVYAIQPTPTDGGLRGEMSNQVNAGNYDGSNLAFPGYATWLSTIGLDGSGVVIANVDSGVQETHPDLVNRMIACTGDTCGGATSSSHGTHTAGIMAGDGASGTTDSDGFLRGQGVAPGANLVEQVYASWPDPDGLLHLMSESYRNTADISGNSWGPSGSPQGYDNATLQVDIGVRDADPDMIGNQPLSYVLSFMNGYGGTSSQGSPDEAKNIFTIGSTKMQTSGGAQILDIDDLSSNSAHGPALDGRTIPHMVAPGCYVDSSVPTNSYGMNCGTSMASPHVAGAAALFIEHYRSLPGYTVDPSPAMIKAAFLPVCHDLAGFDDADGAVLGHPYDSKQGWGRMNLPPVLDSAPGSVRYFDNPLVFENSGEEWTMVVSPVDPAQPMRMMLVWTDAPGHGLGGSTPAWNNNLDLIVEAGGDTYYGNNFDANGWSQTGGTPDDRNNTEGVLLGPTSPGSVTIRVFAQNINSDAIPGVGDTTDQDFAIVIYNAASEPGFTLSSDPAFQGVCAPSDAVYDITVNDIAGFTDDVTLSALGAPAGTTVTFNQNPVTPPATVAMTISGTGAAAAGEYNINVTGVSGVKEQTIGVTLDVTTAAPPTVLLSSPADGAVEQSYTPALSWQTSAQATSYTLEIATDGAFSNIVYTRNIVMPSHTVETSLDSLTWYYWRVRASNTCGVSADSAVFSFITIDQPNYLTQMFAEGANDLAYRTVTFTPNGAADYYDICGDEATELPVDPAGGTTIATGDDGSLEIAPAMSVSLFGQTYNSFWVGGNGFLTFDSADTDYGESLLDHFEQPRISVMFDDLNPSAGGAVSWKELPDRVVVTWDDVPEYLQTETNTMQVELFDTGVIRMTWLQLATADGLVGLSEGTGEPGDFVETDFSSAPDCTVTCPWDLAPAGGDGVVGLGDLNDLLSNWGPCPGGGDPCPWDFAPEGGDGTVGLGDLNALLSNWGPCM